MDNYEQTLIDFLQWHANDNKPFSQNELINIKGSVRRFIKYHNSKKVFNDILSLPKDEQFNIGQQLQSHLNKLLKNPQE